MKRKKASSSRNSHSAIKPGQKNPSIDIYHNFHFSESNFKENNLLKTKSLEYLRIIELYFFFRFENIPKGKEFAEKKLFSDRVLLENFNLQKEQKLFNKIRYGNYKGNLIRVPCIIIKLSVHF
jgi:hypothetical protein